MLVERQAPGADRGDDRRRAAQQQLPAGHRLQHPAHRRRRYLRRYPAAAGAPTVTPHRELPHPRVHLRELPREPEAARDVRQRARAVVASHLGHQQPDRAAARWSRTSSTSTSRRRSARGPSDRQRSSRSPPSPQTVPVGVVLNITPQISDADSVLLNVKPTDLADQLVRAGSDPGPRRLPNLIPQIVIREMESVIKLSSGQMAVMGGLIQDALERPAGLDPVRQPDPVPRRCALQPEHRNQQDRAGDLPAAAGDPRPEPRGRLSRLPRVRAGRRLHDPAESRPSGPATSGSMRGARSELAARGPEKGGARQAERLGSAGRRHRCTGRSRGERALARADARRRRRRAPAHHPRPPARHHAAAGDPLRGPAFGGSAPRSVGCDPRAERRADGGGERARGGERG